MSTVKDITKYSAFISYNHDDKKAALRLHREVERVRYKENGAKKTKSLFPVFIDGHEMIPGPELTDQLKRNLEKSKFLIVLCTKNSAASPTVNQEIEHFKTLPQGKNIIPVILDRFEDLEEGSFPDALGFRENGAMSLAVNLGGEKTFKGKVDRLSLMKVAAPIAGVQLQELWSREKKRLRRNRAIVAASCLFAIVSSVVYWDLFHRKFDQGYKNFYRTPYGWQGIQPVSEYTGQHYRFIKTGRLGSPHTVWVINGDVLCDRLAPWTYLDLYSFRFSAIHQNNPTVLNLCKASFSYRDDGEIDLETLQTSTAPKAQELQLIEEFKYPTDICSNSDVVFTGSLDCEGELRTNLGRFDVKIGYDKNRLSKLIAQQSSGPRRRGDEVFTSHFIEYKYDDASQYAAVEYSDFRGDVVAKLQLGIRDGYITNLRVPDFGTNSLISFEFDHLVFDYDALGRLKEKKLLKDNKLINQAKSFLIGSPKNYVELKGDSFIVYDYINPYQVGIGFFNQAGQKVEILGVHEVRKTEKNGDFNWEFFDLTGNKAGDPNGLHKTISKSTRTDKSRTLNRNWYNTDNEPIVGPHGYFEMTVTSRRRYSGEGLAGISLSKGLMANRYLYDANMDLIENENGVAYLKAEYDHQDRITQLSLHNAQNELIENSLGISKVIWDSTTNDQNCYSANGEPMVLWARRADSPTPLKLACARENLYGYAMIFSQKLDRNDSNIVLEEIYAVGHSLNDRRITGRRTFHHKGGGIIIEKSIDHVLNQNSQIKNLGIMKKWNGVILMEEGFFDHESDERMNNQFGYSFARYSIENNINGSVQKISFYNKDEDPVRESTTGAYALENYTDASNKIVKQLFYDDKMQPRSGNYYSIEYDYRDNGKSMYATAFDAQGNVFSSNIAGVEFDSVVYSEKSSLGAYMKKQFLDEDEQIVTLLDGTYSVQLETEPVSNQTIQVWRNEQGAVLGRAPIYQTAILSW